jgi:hypothetical protein
MNIINKGKAKKKKKKRIHIRVRQFTSSPEAA